MKPPVVGITMSVDPGARIRPGHAYLYVGRAYAHAVRAAGATPILIPPDAAPEAVLRLCDALVVTGGGMLPEAFGAGEPEPPDWAEHAERIDADRALLERALAAGTPVLGVCYGLQLLNLHLGGTLCADLRDAVAGALDHGGAGRVTHHDVALDAGSALGAALGASARVASSHRQAVARIAPGARAVARAADGVLEALEGDGWLGVEWHPELDATAPAVYGALVERARGRA